MPQTQSSENKTPVIPVDQIQEIVLPYEYQKPQNGFGSITAEGNMTSKNDAQEKVTSDRN